MVKTAASDNLMVVVNRHSNPASKLALYRRIGSTAKQTNPSNSNDLYIEGL